MAALFVVANLTAPPTQLSVMRVHPEGVADARTEITVTFDRPVAAGLDATVDAERIFRIEPAVAGRIEWRDPITLRFKPAVALTPGATYRVSITNDFAAMDGTHLAQPYTFTFRVNPPKILAGDPVTAGNNPKFITLQPVFRLLVSAPADPRLIIDQGFVQVSQACGGARVPLDLVRVRRVTSEDAGEIRYNSVRYDEVGDTLRDLRRIVEVRTRTVLPRGCAAVLNVPADVVAGAVLQRWPFQTFGPLRVTTVECATKESCPTGPIRLLFSTPVRGSEVMRRVRLAPALPFTVSDTGDISEGWYLNAELKPRQSYAVVVDSLLTDIFGQKLGALSVKAFATTSYSPTVNYDFGKMLVERSGMRTLATEIVNVDTLVVTTIAIPEREEVRFLSQTWRWGEPFDLLKKLAVERRIPLKPAPDQPFITGVTVPANDARVTHNGTLVAIRMHASTEKDPDKWGAIALVQVTDLAIHGRMALDGGSVWVTGVRDGKPRAGATVTLYNADGKSLGVQRTNTQGFAQFTGVHTSAPAQDCEEDACGTGFEGYVAAVLDSDRAVTGFSNYDPDLAAWQFDISAGWSAESRTAAAAAVFTERGIYRPGEQVYAKAIVRDGTLGSLTVPRGDSAKWSFTDREGTVLRDTVTALSPFGTADQSIALTSDAALGQYSLQLSIKRSGEWLAMAATTYEVAEYRPPEFLVDVNANTKPRFGGDSVAANISARYLFGAPMAAAQVRWVVQHKTVFPWDLEIPNTDGWDIGSYNWEEDNAESTVDAEHIDTLDGRGSLNVRVGMPVLSDGQPARTGIYAIVTDANRQTSSAGRSIIVHPAEFYVGAKVRGREYFWRVGTPVAIDLIAVRPTGERVSDVSVEGAIIRREWNNVRRVRDGEISEVGGWVSDTVARCRVRVTSDGAPCEFTPAEGGSYMVVFTAHDSRGRIAMTTMWRWAAGKGFVPWRDDKQLRIDIIADKQRYSVGDTATLLIASPFTNVDAWLTIERERVLESRMLHITAGATTVKVPITEALAPNAFVSILMVRGRNAPPGPLDDPGRPALRVGYIELRVLPAVKKLDVQVAPVRAEYKPGEEAQVRVAVKDASGAGQRAEVTLWAVDEGVLALTAYQVPDPVDLLYQPRPLGVRLTSNLVSVAAQVPAGMKGKRAPGGGGGNDVAGVLRSRFQTTAFFLGSVVTDAQGNATASARLPDNLTTFRVMAVAVTAGDRYGSGKSSLLVTRPLVARPSLPRFVRPGDRFAAGVVVNQRTGGARKVDVEASARGIALNGAKKKTETVNGAAGTEVRFDFTAQPGDTAHFQFSARSGQDLDAVALRIPIRPNYYPLAQTIAGSVRDTASALFTLEQDVDPARSVLDVSFGSSTLAIISGARDVMRVYPYYCTEQISSSALPLIALYRARLQTGVAVPAASNAASDISTAIRVILRRQRPDGGIGYWSSTDWSSPWLTAYATRVLLEARAAGFAVDSVALDHIGDYLMRALHEPPKSLFAVAHWYDNQRVPYSDKVAAVDLLSRLGKADIATENILLGQAAQLFWEDRVLLAEVVARRGALPAARTLLAAAWMSVSPSGRKLELPVSEAGFYFESDVRPAARLLLATLAIEPAHPQLGALVETLVDNGRAAGKSLWWNTQDYGWTVLALLAYERVHAANAHGTIRITGANGVVLTRNIDGATARDTSFALTGLTRANTLGLKIQTETAGTPIYYYLTVREVPRVAPVTPVDRGIQVERWYESVDTRQPIVRAAAGDIVRVRLRITVPGDRRFIVVDDPLPAGLEAIDLSLRTVELPAGLKRTEKNDDNRDSEDSWYYGTWDAGVWSAFDHKEMRDDRVVYFATYLWRGTYTATYLARATTAGVFVVPPAHSEEMYNPGVNGRTGGGQFTVTK